MLRGIAPVSAFARIPLVQRPWGFFTINCFFGSMHYSSRMQAHVMNVLKDAGLFNSYKLCTILDYDASTCHRGFQSTKHGRNSTFCLSLTPGCPWCAQTAPAKLRKRIRQFNSPPEDVTYKPERASQPPSHLCFAMLPDLETIV